MLRRRLGATGLLRRRGGAEGAWRLLLLVLAIDGGLPRDEPPDDGALDAVEGVPLREGLRVRRVLDGGLLGDEVGPSIAGPVDPADELFVDFPLRPMGGDMVDQDSVIEASGSMVFQLVPHPPPKVCVFVFRRSAMLSALLEVGNGVGRVREDREGGRPMRSTR